MVGNTVCAGRPVRVSRKQASRNSPSVSARSLKSNELGRQRRQQRKSWIPDQVGNDKHTYPFCHSRENGNPESIQGHPCILASFLGSIWKRISGAGPLF